MSKEENKNFYIQTKNEDGHEEKFEVDCNMTIKILKEKIINTLKIDEIDLMFGNLLLNDDCTLESYNINNSDCVLKIMKKKIRVTIKGKIGIDEFDFELNLDNNDTLKEIKLRINQLKNYPIDKFNLLDKNNNKIEENKNLKELNIKNNDIIKITFKEDNFDRFYYENSNKKKIYIKFNIKNKKNQNEIEMITDANIYIEKLKEDIKQNLKQQLDIDCNSFLLYNKDQICLNNNQTLLDYPNLDNPIKLNLVENPENNILYLKKINDNNPIIYRNIIKLEDKVIDIKMELNKVLKIFYEKIELSFNNQILENEKTLNDYNIKYSDTIYFKELDLFNLQIKDKTIPIFSSSESNIYEFKSKIEEKTNIPLYQQKMISIIDNRSFQRYKENRNIDDVIELKKKLFFIVIYNDLKSFLIDLYDDLSFEVLKKKIYDQLKKLEYEKFENNIFDKNNIIENLLVFDENNNEINSSNFNNLREISKPINIKVTTKINLKIKYYSKTIEKSIRADTYIEDLKNDLANELNIPYSEIILKLENENYLLENNKTFYFNINQNLKFEYYLILERIKTLIINNSNEYELFEIGINQKIKDLKNRIKAKFRLNNFFNIFLNNQQLDENKLLWDYSEIKKPEISTLYLN